MSERRFIIKVTYEGKIVVPSRMKEEIINTYRPKHQGDETAVLATYKKKRDNVSPNQRGYYWGVLVPIVLTCMNEDGYQLSLNSKEHLEYVHSILKDHFLPDEEADAKVYEIEGKTTRRLKTISDKDTVQINQYFEKIWLFMAEEWGVNCPRPNEPFVFWDSETGEEVTVSVKDYLLHKQTNE